METLQDLGKEYQQQFAALAPYRDSVWKIDTVNFLSLSAFLSRRLL
ncbi:MAG: hypothetical protein JWM68_5404 [Verrucomicrobiales bacterium]|nr:hypothetical protein [Verrucomicrobiales bacterium]